MPRRHARSPLANAEVAAALLRIAELLELEDANPFRVRAYQVAARTVAELERPLAALLAEGFVLDDLPGIGADLAEKITTLHRTGTCPLLTELEARVPEGLRALLAVPGLGPKRVRRLHEELGVRGLADLERAARRGEVARLRGFGADLERRLLAGTQEARRERRAGRVLWPIADALGRELVDHLRAAPGVEAAELAGSLRRRRETVGDLDLLVTAADARPVAERLARFGGVEAVLERGPRRVAVRLRSGLRVDVRVTPAESRGAALIYLTGSKAHGVRLRQRAVGRGLKLNEYGVWRGRTRLGGATEAEVYGALGLPVIPPELREDRGEVDAADRNALPRLVEARDLRGDLHVHSTTTDGRASLAEMVEAARARGLQWLATTEHSHRVRVARGLDADGLLRHLDAVDALNERLRGFRVLRSVEVDILPDGGLDLPDAVLVRLDLVVGAVHYPGRMGRTEMTERLLRAMDHRCLDVLAHPTGRLLGERPGYEVDLPRLLAGARERGCFVELNGQPQRLDLDDAGCRMAKELGVRVALGSDAHAPAELAFLDLAVAQARRGWLEPDDVLNTRPWKELLALRRPR